MRMQQENADPLAEVDIEDDSAATREALEKLTRLSDKKQMANFLSFGKWGLNEADIERLQKDDEMRQRVSIVNCFLGGFQRKKKAHCTFFHLKKYLK